MSSHTTHVIPILRSNKEHALYFRNCETPFSRTRNGPKEYIDSNIEIAIRISFPFSLTVSPDLVRTPSRTVAFDAFLAPTKK